MHDALKFYITYVFFYTISKWIIKLLLKNYKNEYNHILQKEQYLSKLLKIVKDNIVILKILNLFLMKILHNFEEKSLAGLR